MNGKSISHVVTFSILVNKRMTTAVPSAGPTTLVELTTTMEQTTTELTTVPPTVSTTATVLESTTTTNDAARTATQLGAATEPYIFTCAYCF